MIHGRNLILALDGTPLAGSKSCTVDMQQSFIPIASPTSGRWEESVPERLSWKITSDGLLIAPENFNALKAAMDNGTKLLIRYYDTTYGINQSGYAYLESLNYAGSVGSLARYSVSLRGTGALSAYSGTEIAMSLQTDIQGYYYYAPSYNTAYYRGDEGFTKGYNFVLSARTEVRFATNGCDFMLCQNGNIHEDVDREQDIDLQDFGADWYDGNQTIWLNAGTYSVVFTTDAHTEPSPKIYKLN